MIFHLIGISPFYPEAHIPSIGIFFAFMILNDLPKEMDQAPYENS
jgi:hypothetical protein